MPDTPGGCAMCDLPSGTGYWAVSAPTPPLPGTRLHLLIVPRDHVPDLADLPPAAGDDFWRILRELRAEHALTFYGLTMATGPHAYAQVIVGDVEAPGHRGVRVEIGG